MMTICNAITILYTSAKRDGREGDAAIAEKALVMAKKMHQKLHNLTGEEFGTESLWLEQLHKETAEKLGEGIFRNPK